LSAVVDSEIGAQPSGSVTRVPDALMRAISSGANIEKKVSDIRQPFGRVVN
jgi:hypothetical protein